MENERVIESHIKVDKQDAAPVDLLAEETGLSKSKIKDAMRKGAVWLTDSGRQKRLRRVTRTIREGSLISIYYSPKILAMTPPEPGLIADKGNYSVWHKPAGMMASGSRYGDHCAIDRIVERTFDKPTFLVHRLDRFVWGLMVLAHTRSSAAGLSRQFQTRQTSKTYKALVHGRLDHAQLIDTPLEGKDAVTRIRPLRQESDRSLVEVQIETGRKHQIRKHLSMVGHPVVGDRQYGSSSRDGIQLAAVGLAFICPNTNKHVRFDLPDRFHPD